MNTLKSIVTVVSITICLLGSASVALSAPEGLVGHWPLDGDLVDVSGNGYDGELVDGVMVENGLYGGALSCSGSTSQSFARVPNVVPEMKQGEFSVTLWFNRSNGDAVVGAWGAADADNAWYNGHNFNTRVYADGHILISNYTRTGPSYDFISEGGFFTDGEWTHLAVTQVVTGGGFATAKGYINGQEIVSGTAHEFIGHDTGHLVFGSRTNNGRNLFEGLIDDVGLFNRVLTAEEILTRIIPGVGSKFEIASSPMPADGEPGVPRDGTVLSWEPGDLAASHDVYFGENFDDVNTATPDSELFKGNQPETTYPLGRLAFDKTYYWRIDEVNDVDPNSPWVGDVWSFTVESLAHPISGERITASASSQTEGQGPENTVNGSGLDANDLHSTNVTDMWLSSVDDPGPVWIESEFNKVYKLHEMQIWNYNGQSVLTLFGLKDVTIEYSTDGVNWTQLADVPEVAAATGMEDYVYNTTVAFGDAAVKFVKITANSNWSNGLFTQYGLSEVRFMYIPTDAGYPLPEDGATDIAIDTTLGWGAGREAAEHNVYISKDEQSVLDGTASVVTVPTTSYGPLSLDLGSVYYWRVDEVNNVNAVPIWEGNIWSFTTQEYLVVDDFESYNDINEGEEGSNRIYLTWLDGYDDPANGSQVGYDDPPLAEQVIVHSGRQSMPLSYNNTGGVNNSESTRTFSTAQDWTRAGIKTLTLYVYGQADNVGGQFYVKVNGIEKAVDVDFTAESWQEVNIELATSGVSLTNVTALSIGVDDSNAKGLVYVDDVLLK